MKGKERYNQFPSAPLKRPWASASVGRAGIAPFLVVVMAPHAFANLNTSLSLASSCQPKPIINHPNFGT